MLRNICGHWILLDILHCGFLFPIHPLGHKQSSKNNTYERILLGLTCVLLTSSLMEASMGSDACFLGTTWGYMCMVDSFVVISFNSRQKTAHHLGRSMVGWSLGCPLNVFFLMHTIHSFHTRIKMATESISYTPNCKWVTYHES